MEERTASNITILRRQVLPRGLNRYFPVFASIRQGNKAQKPGPCIILVYGNEITKRPVRGVCTPASQAPGTRL